MEVFFFNIEDLLCHNKVNRSILKERREEMTSEKKEEQIVTSVIPPNTRYRHTHRSVKKKKENLSTLGI